METMKAVAAHHQESAQRLFNDLASMYLAFKDYARTPAQESALRAARRALDLGEPVKRKA